MRIIVLINTVIQQLPSNVGIVYIAEGKTIQFIASIKYVNYSRLIKNLINQHNNFIQTCLVSHLQSRLKRINIAVFINNKWRTLLWVGLY